ncbi:MAG: hypothetical protein BWY68_00747 [bacterium ADurb.Bin400]|nr:MAG: hypothetical protein BWY68_00747 [bacterium ADurb.Bin400]
MSAKLFHNISHKDKLRTIDALVALCVPSHNFFFMIILAVIMATLGLLLNNTSIVIGSALLAPILYPIMGISMGTVMSDYKLIMISAKTLAKSVVLAVIAAAFATILFADTMTVPQIVYELSRPSLMHAAVAVVAGLAASFAMVRSELNETLPGVAISAALIPPLAVVGIGVGEINMEIISGAFLLFLVNVAGITFAGVTTFSLMNFYVDRKEADKALEVEERPSKAKA